MIDRHQFAIHAALILVLFASSSAQTKSCQPVDIPINFLLPNGELLTGIRADQITSQVKGKPVGFESLTYDTEPHRLMFILDMRRYLSTDARRAELGIVEGIVDNARSQDQFALLTLGGASSELKFSENRDPLRAALKDPAQLKDTNAPGGTLDAVLRGLDWFQTPQMGDGVILMTADEKLSEGNRARFSDVLDALWKKDIRLFSFSLGPPILGTIYYSYRGAGAFPSDGVDANTESLAALTWNSGGYPIEEDTLDLRHTYRLTPERLTAVQRKGVYMYAAIEEFYRVRIMASGWTKSEGWNLDLSGELRKKVPTAKVIYPRHLTPCLSTQK